MVDLADLARRLAEATDVPTAAELFAEQLVRRFPGGAARVYLLGPGDRCATCPRARECSLRDRCLHLEASLGSFAMPPGHAERLPRAQSPWSEALSGRGAPGLGAPPPEIAPPTETGAAGTALLVPLVAGAETIGVLALRAGGVAAREVQDEVVTASSLAASTLRHLAVRAMESRRYEQLLLVNALGRKVTSILNDDLLLRQAAVDIHRTFGFHNVMILMLDPSRSRLLLRAQASRRSRGAPPHDVLPLDQGIVGRVFRGGVAEVVDDVSADKDFVGWYDDTRSEIAVPIQVEGVVEGVLNVESDRIAAFGAMDRLVLETVANQLAIALENARLFGMVKEREDRYRTLVESSPGAVLHLDLDGRIIYANPAVSEITGRDKAFVLAQEGGLVGLTALEERARLDEAIQGALRGLPCRDLEFHVRHADGSLRWVRASLQPLIGEHGDPKGVVVLARDQTEERELQDRLRQSEKLSSIGTLVSGVAHELNNPLAGILGFAQLLLGRPIEEWTRADIEKIEKNARRCQRIVENLLAFARQSRMTKRHANMNEVIDSVLRLNEYQFRMDNVEIQRSFDPDVPPIYIDVNRWQQVFINLANNAREALVGGDCPNRVIRFETRMTDGDLVIRVSDTGPGVPDSLRSRVFEPFFTTKETGTGLGLGICWGIVRDHGGTIEVETANGPGAWFRIAIPVAQAGTVTVEPAAFSEAPTRSDVGLGKRVLVVDDDPSVCDVIVQTLENHRYSVDVATDGQKAMERIRATPYDVVLSDLRMPGELDGFGLFERVREEMPHLCERFVFLTGNVLDADTMTRLSSLRVRCVEKPFDIHHLARVVSEIASGSREPARTEPA